MQIPSRTHVPAGTYYVSRITPVILQAFLGTCVGVALFDDKARVGGLIHLLLPEPVSREGNFQPEKYASTGFPIFLKALYNEGADKNRLKAFIAGGALVGPIFSRDLQLDIGGRTAETVMNYLMEEKIQIEKSETGGFFTCCLSLDMQNGKCRIEPTAVRKIRNENSVDVPAGNEIEKAIERVRPIPQVALKILRLIDEEEYEIKALTEEVRKDQVISARTLKLCNSAVFAGTNKIESLDHALVYLGLKLLVKLVVSAAVADYFSHSGLGYSLCKGGLYHHAVGTAIIAEKLADVTGTVSPGLAYTAGLLHDIGKVVLDQYITLAYPLFYRELFEEGNNFSEAEKTILGIDHTQVGGCLARKWSFPASLINSVRHHHKPENTTQNPELVHIVYLADLLMSRFQTGFELERLGTDDLSSKLETIGLSIERFPEVVDLIPAGVFESSPELAIMQRSMHDEASILSKDK
jgi:putative nucleotidyltransferase with HDIG domain